MKILKIKIGEIYQDGKTVPVYQTAWQKKSKTGDIYYEIKTPIFVNEVKEKEEPVKINVVDV